MAGDFSVAVALREGGRVNTFGTRFLKAASADRASRHPILSQEDFQYLLGPEGEEAMDRLLRSGRKALYIRADEDLPFGVNGRSLFSAVFVEAQEISYARLVEELSRNRLTIATPAEVSGFIAYLRKNILDGKFWLKDEGVLVRGDLRRPGKLTQSELHRRDIVIARKF